MLWCFVAGVPEAVGSMPQRANELMSIQPIGGNGRAIFGLKLQFSDRVACFDEFGHDLRPTMARALASVSSGVPVALTLCQVSWPRLNPPGAARRSHPHRTHPARALQRGAGVLQGQRPGTDRRIWRWHGAPPPRCSIVRRAWQRPHRQSPNNRLGQCVRPCRSIWNKAVRIPRYHMLPAADVQFQPGQTSPCVRSRSAAPQRLEAAQEAGPARAPGRICPCPTGRPYKRLQGRRGVESSK
jgi:hypothetical protein